MTLALHETLETLRGACQPGADPIETVRVFRLAILAWVDDVERRDAKFDETLQKARNAFAAVQRDGKYREDFHRSLRHQGAKISEVQSALQATRREAGMARIKFTGQAVPDGGVACSATGDASSG